MTLYSPFRFLARWLCMLALMCAVLVPVGARAAITQATVDALDDYFSANNLGSVSTYIWEKPSDTVYSRSPDTSIRTASTAKLVTVYMILKAVNQGIMELDDVVVTPAFIGNMAERDRNPTALQTNQQATVIQLISYAMVGSKNDAAMLLAYYLLSKDSRYGIQLPPATDTNINSSDHQRWIAAFGEAMTDVARAELDATNKTVFCNPAGFDSLTGTGGGCGSKGVTTARELAVIADKILERTQEMPDVRVHAANLLSHDYLTQYASAHTIVGGRVVDVRFSTACRLYEGFSQHHIVQLSKTGTTASARNIIVAVDIPGTGGCDARRLYVSLMGMPAGSDRSKVMGDIINIVSRYDVTVSNQTQQCTPLAYSAAQGTTACGGQYQPSPGRTVDEAATRTYLGYDDIETAIAEVSPNPDMSSVNTGDSAAGSTGVSIDPGLGSECDAADNDAYMNAERYRFSTVMGAIGARFSYAFHEQIWNNGCMKKFADMLDQARTVMDRAKDLGNGWVAAAISIAVRNVVRALMDQILQNVTNMICSVSNQVYSYIDSATKNLLCFKNPIAKNPLKPFSFDLDLGDMAANSCQGLAINPAAILSTDPNAQITSGTVFGVTPEPVTRGDLGTTGESSTGSRYQPPCLAADRLAFRNPRDGRCYYADDNTVVPTPATAPTR